MGQPGALPTNALGAIVDFERQLRAAGIHLVFVPIPVKPFIYPEQVWPDYPAAAGPAWNRDRDAFKAKLAEAGVDVLDVTDDLWNAKAQSSESLFLKLDTHWTPRGLAVVADRLAAHLRPHVSVPGRPHFTTRKQRVTNYRRPAENSGNSACQRIVRAADRRDRPDPRGWRTGERRRFLASSASGRQLHEHLSSQGNGMGRWCWVGGAIDVAPGRWGPGCCHQRRRSDGGSRNTRAETCHTEPQEGRRVGLFGPRSLRRGHRVGSRPTHRGELSSVMWESEFLS